ncbi:PKD2 [Symbiodinium natans]|uniref:PKD2 protein n=1 Tax=Symbiodinium natans TaxID=878477 RepID=A0A812SBV9_9DINO|nr:PKD2 [Symbiodinium natans]
MGDDVDVGGKIDSLRELGIWPKIAEGDIHLVTRRDVLELFRVLDDRRKGTIQTTDLMTLQAVDVVKLTESELKALAKDADRDGNGYCTVTRLRISSHQFFAISTPELHPLVGMGTVKHVIRMCYLLGATHSLPLFRSLSYWISS